MNQEPTPTEAFISQAQRRLILPVTLAASLLFSLLILNPILNAPLNLENFLILAMGVLGVLYTLALHFLLSTITKRRQVWPWFVTIINSLGLGLLIIILPDDLDIIGLSLFTLAMIVTAITQGRLLTYMFFFISFISYLVEQSGRPQPLVWIGNLAPLLLGIILAETILRLQKISNRQIRRLETLNEFARKISSSIETEEVISLLHTAIQKSLEADSYYVAFLKGNSFELSLFYDEGVNFSGIKVAVKGTLAGWVIKNKQSLLIHNLRKQEMTLDIDYMVIGKDKVSSSWMGAPVQVDENAIGVIAVASYSINAFDRTDLRLIESLAQQVGLALDNAYHHAKVEQQSRLDSMTQVYNHGHFLEKLQEAAEQASHNDIPFSLIMLDVDNFKQYNDRYGHLVGDQVLLSLTDTIQRHVKKTDAVGRWGGEEFAIALPKASGLQAFEVAKRIQETLKSLTVSTREGETIPLPTISQGIAVYPSEAVDIYRLIDVADRRLYIAKGRGRNQIEPSEKAFKSLHRSRNKRK